MEAKREKEWTKLRSLERDIRGAKNTKGKKRGKKKGKTNGKFLGSWGLISEHESYEKV